MTIKYLISTSKTRNNLPDYFKINNSNVTDTQEIANEFNKFFIEIGPKLASKISEIQNNTFRPYLNNPFHDTVKLNTIREQYAVKIINEHAQ